MSEPTDPALRACPVCGEKHRDDMVQHVIARHPDAAHRVLALAAAKAAPLDETWHNHHTNTAGWCEECVSQGRALAWTEARAEAEATIAERLTRVYETARADALDEGVLARAMDEEYQKTPGTMRHAASLIAIRYRAILSETDR